MFWSELLPSVDTVTFVTELQWIGTELTIQSGIPSGRLSSTPYVDAIKVDSGNSQILPAIGTSIALL